RIGRRVAQTRCDLHDDGGRRPRGAKPHGGGNSMNAGVLSAHERKVLDWLAAQGEAMQALLKQLVDIDSGSRNKAGVDKVGGAICAFLEKHGVRFETMP